MVSYRGTKQQRTEYMRQWRKKHPNVQAGYANRFVAARRAVLNEAKSRPCMDCGNSYPPCVMDFDHRDPASKSANVGHLIHAPLDRLVAEIAKCDLVCANCHRIRTFLKNL